MYLAVRSSSSYLILVATLRFHPLFRSSRLFLLIPISNRRIILLNQQDYKEIGDPQIDGNKLVVRRVTNEGEIDFSYLLVIEGTKGVMGSVKAPADKEADAEKALNSILASVKMK